MNKVYLYLGSNIEFEQILPKGAKYIFVKGCIMKVKLILFFLNLTFSALYI